jgi:apocytochrome f
LAQKPIDIEVPQSVLPDQVFEAVVSFPSNTPDKQLTSSGSLSPINVGSILILPDGFKIAPKQRFSAENKEKTKGVFIQAYNKEKPNILVVGPIARSKNPEIVFPVISPDPSVDKRAHFLNYPVYAAANRGRGQIYPDGKSAASSSSTVEKPGQVKEVYQKAGATNVVVQTQNGKLVKYTLKKGASLAVRVGDILNAGQDLTREASASGSGFGQAETTLVLQKPVRIKGLLGYFLSVWLLQVALVLKKKQFESVQNSDARF